MGGYIYALKRKVDFFVRPKNLRPKNLLTRRNNIDRIMATYIHKMDLGK